MKQFVKKDSIVRQIWGKSDTILFIFAGAASEFALNKAVDWLYFTGKLPADPLARLFSTVAYARRIVFSEHEAALRAIDQITAIHHNVEQDRGAKIPDWAYRDVLYMLIDYSIRSFELLERKLSPSEKEEVLSVFCALGSRMQIPGLPLNYAEWDVARKEQSLGNMMKGAFTVDLYRQYRKHLGAFRYLLLKQAQILVVPKEVNDLLKLGSIPLLAPVVAVYKLSRLLRLDGVVKGAILPPAYKEQIAALDFH